MIDTKGADAQVTEDVDGAEDGYEDVENHVEDTGDVMAQAGEKLEQLGLRGANTIKKVASKTTKTSESMLESVLEKCVNVLNKTASLEKRDALVKWARNNPKLAVCSLQTFPYLLWIRLLTRQLP